ncbi:rRNA methyltransferase [Nocardia sp. MDA0666]|uniref:TrmH family RNA methyltransferase n=1 Tax=Nocardia sp. MDA0666 TaxID=2135448 RepID=UPI000D135EC3|nr:TrmH family RNA methyltransferase [Nocardia sp. MDA0666]PSR59606.1 rRNA methyltransferase [Nocardia sp. MDA0666]
MTRPSTTRNASVGEWRAYLGNRARRRGDGRFLVHGREPITAAVANGWPLEAVLYRLGAPLPPWAREVLDNDAVPAIGLVGDALDELAEPGTGTPELVALAHTRGRDPSQICLDPAHPVVVIDRPSSALRLGSVLRTAHAFDAAAVVISGSGADEYDPQCVRASAGALFAVPVVRVSGPAAVAEFRAGTKVPARLVGVGTGPGDRPIDAHTFADATIMVLADDGELDARWRDACDEMVRIPAGAMPVTPCAVSVVLYEISRQRRVSVSRVNAGAAGE